MIRNSLLAATAVCLLGTPAPAQKWAEKMFETTSHDFGTVARGAKAEYKFVLKNIYVEDVHIAGVRVSCGCTTPRIEKPLLKTYEKGGIVASINSDRFSGRQASTITVTFDKPLRARVQLHVKANIQPDVVIDPATMHFGDIHQGNGAQQTVSIGSTRGGDWRIEEVKCGNQHLSAEAVEIARQGNRASYELRVRLNKDAPPGYIKEHLILITNDPRATQIPVSVEGHVLSPITVSPDSLFFGVVEPGATVGKKIVIRGTRPFHVTAITADCDCLTFDMPDAEPPKALYVVPVAFSASGVLGKVSAVVRIETDLDGTTAELEAHAAVVER
jgi:hypothetical protein